MKKHSFFKRWTKGSIDCYDRHCICDGCFYNEFFNGKCKMKKTVIEMVRVLGKPPQAKHFNGILED
jgi:hypothetical protein